MSSKNQLEEEILSKFSSAKKEIKAQNNKNKILVDEVEQKWLMNRKIIDLFVTNIENDQNLRNRYAIILIIILGIMLLSLLVIFVLVGRGVLTYSETTFNIFITGGIAEVFVLVRVIVKYLFKDNLTNALNTILRTNNQTNYQTRFTQSSNNKNLNKSK